MGLTDYIGERWTDPTGQVRVITRTYMGAEGEYNDDGSPVLWVVFDNSNLLTYNIIELHALGWNS